MDYSYYNQTPYQFEGFPQDSGAVQQESHSNGYLNAIPPLAQNFDTSFDTFSQNIYETENFAPPLLGNHRQSLQSLQLSPASSVSPSISRRNSRRKVSSSDRKVKRDFEHGLQRAGSDSVVDDIMNRTRSSSEEKDSLTPVQSKRKAQNRAAQRAFRERKERHVKELETRLNEMEAQFTSLHSENEQLKRELARFATENEILRATSSSASHHPKPAKERDEIMKAGPMEYTPTDFLSTTDCHSSTRSESVPNTSSSPSSSSSNFPKPHPNNSIESQVSSRTGSFLPSAHRITTSPITGQRLLSAGSTWDFILAHPLYKQGLIDVADVSERLKGKAECDGSGPVFGEAVIRTAIEEAAGTSKTASGTAADGKANGGDVLMSTRD